MIEKQIAMTVPADELAVIINALNEVCSALDIGEFDTRMGASIEFTRALLLKAQARLDAEPS